MNKGSLVSVLLPDQNVYFPAQRCPKWLYLCGKDWNDPEARVQKTDYKVVPRLFGRKDKTYNVGEKVLVQMKRPHKWDGTATVWCEGTVTETPRSDGLYCIKTKAGMREKWWHYLFVGPNKLHTLLEKETNTVRRRRSGRKRKAKKIFDL